MKIITKPQQLENEFLRLLDEYSNYYWSTAWASSSSRSFEKLHNNIQKVKQLVVGVHFYQTHPDFIESFLECENVKYIKQVQGTFHPKLFIFFNDKSDWEIIVGSANFTKAAFTINTEVSTLISPKDLNSNELLKTSLNFIDDLWKKAERFDEKELEDYKIIWKNLKPKRDSLSGNYGAKNLKKNNKPIHLASIVNMRWDTFIWNIKNEELHSFNSRIGVLEVSRTLFKKVNSFMDLTENERKFIAGIPNNLEVGEGIDWAFFGSMKGAGVFKNRIKQNDIEISKALDEVPLFGQITKAHYDGFLKCFTRVFSGNYLVTATRLLAMKRPDVFVCLSSKNKSALCENFGIIRSGLDYERYWDDIILRIYDSEWWLNPKPKDKTERKISGFRAAFLDALYYRE